jgi:SAM-dependent methyltransferase
LAWLFLERRTDLFDRRPKRMLHFAPEPVFARRLPGVPGIRYVTADLSDRRAMTRLDITRIPCGADSFDVVYCSHVLEHVADDLAAMREVRRVVRRGGWALFQVPISAARTIEDPRVTDPRERLRRFGQADHVRRYGRDFVERLRGAGFDVREISAADIADCGGRIRYGLARESLFFCTRANSAKTQARVQDAAFAAADALQPGPSDGASSALREPRVGPELADSAEPRGRREARMVRRAIEGSYRAGRKLVIASVGATIVLLGVLMIVLPGPAIVVVPLGLAILGIEFAWARRIVRGLERRFASATSRFRGLRDG